jgi:hypothetical protein
MCPEMQFHHLGFNYLLKVYHTDHKKTREFLEKNIGVALTTYIYCGIG